jgi:hypothetical protein
MWMNHSGRRITLHASSNAALLCSRRQAGCTAHHQQQLHRPVCLISDARWLRQPLLGCSLHTRVYDWKHGLLGVP